MRLGHRDLVAGSTLVLLPVLLLGRALLPGHVLSPADILLATPPWSSLEPGLQPVNPLLTDVAMMIHPFHLYAAHAVGTGRFPLWNPHLFTGAPFFANPQTALLFPLTWLWWALPAPTAIGLAAILVLALGGLGTYAFVRQLGIAPLPSLTGAITYMLHAGLVVWLQWPLGPAMALLPLLFAATEHLRERTSARRVAGLALAVALAILAGYPQLAALGILAAGAWALVRAPGAARPRVFAACWAAATGIGIVLTAVQLLPFAEYLTQSVVLEARTRWMALMAVPPRTAITLLMPGYYGTPSGRDFWGYWNFNETAASVGPVPFVLACVAVLGGRWRTPTRFFLGLGLLGAAVAYQVPGLTVALTSIPPFSMLIAFRSVALLAFSLSVLTAVGLATLAAGPVAARRVSVGVRFTFLAIIGLALLSVWSDAPVWSRLDLYPSVVAQFLMLVVLLTPATLLLLLRLAGRGEGPAPTPVLLGVQLAALVPLAITANPVIETRHFYPPPPPALRHVQVAQATEPGRTLLATTLNVGMLLGLDEVAGYDGITPRRVRDLASPGAGSGLNLLASGPMPVSVDPSTSVFDLLGIRYVVVPQGTAPPTPHFVLDYTGPDGIVYRNPRALPRTFLVPRARCADDATGLHLLHDGEIDPRQVVVLGGCEGGAAPGAPGGSGRATLRVAGAERLVVDVDATGPAYLVLTDTWFPGWEVRVDRAPRTLWRADHAFRAVLVPAGRHEVEFRYAPRTFRAGLGLSGAAAAVIALLAMPWRRRGVSA